MSGVELGSFNGELGSCFLLLWLWVFRYVFLCVFFIIMYWVFRYFQCVCFFLLVVLD